MLHFVVGLGVGLLIGVLVGVLAMAALAANRDEPAEPSSGTLAPEVGTPLPPS